MVKILANKRFLTGLQISVAAIALVVLAFQWWKRDGFSFFSQVDSGNFLYVLLVFLLLPVNWLAEANKWRILVRDLQPLTLWQSLAIVVRALPYGTITPYRTGEWVGRSMEMQSPWQATLLAMVAGYLQQLMTIVIGLIGIWVLFLDRSLSVALAIVVVFVSGFFGIKLLSKRLKLLKPWSLVGWNAYFGALQWAALRYLVFSSQYVLLLKAFGIAQPWLLLYLSVFVIYLSVNLLPLNTLADLGVRANVAVLLLGGHGDVLSLTFASIGVWVINNGLTSVFGSIWLMIRGIRQQNV